MSLFAWSFNSSTRSICVLGLHPFFFVLLVLDLWVTIHHCRFPSLWSIIIISLLTILQIRSILVSLNLFSSLCCPILLSPYVRLIPLKVLPPQIHLLFPQYLFPYIRALVKPFAHFVNPYCSRAFQLLLLLLCSSERSKKQASHNDVLGDEWQEKYVFICYVVTSESGSLNLFCFVFGLLKWFCYATEIGLGLTAFGVFFSFLGIMFVFDKGLLAMGNVCIVPLLLNLNLYIISFQQLLLTLSAFSFFRFFSSLGLV